MGQILLPENIPYVVRSSSSLATFAATYKGQPTRLNIGGQQYTFTTALSLSTAIIGGAGGVDTTWSSGNYYYIYAIVQQNSNNLALLVSLITPYSGSLPTIPSGYADRVKCIGGFIYNSTYGIINSPKEYSSITLTKTGFTVSSEISNFRRVGSCIQIYYMGILSTMSSTFAWQLQGLSLNGSKISLAQCSHMGSCTGLGPAYFYNGSLETDSNSQTFWMLNYPGNKWGSDRPVTWAAGNTISFATIEIPIVGWTDEDFDNGYIML